jgi:hypothetical protein
VKEMTNFLNECCLSTIVGISDIYHVNIAWLILFTNLHQEIFCNRLAKRDNQELLTSNATQKWSIIYHKQAFILLKQEMQTTTQGIKQPLPLLLQQVNKQLVVYTYLKRIIN